MEVDYDKVNWNSPDKRDNRDPEELGIEILGIASEGAYSFTEAADRAFGAHSFRLAAERVPPPGPARWGSD